MTPDCRLELPGGKVTPVNLGFSGRIGTPGPFSWPEAKDARGRTVDLSRLPPPEEKSREFIYVEDLPEGWCGVLHEPSGSRLRMRFATSVFPYTWIFMDFGGWRGLYVAVLEPCTAMPKDLHEAARLGRCSSLDAGASLSCDVAVEIS